jgi:4-amino-4-deoxy-L-arabinose transferase-like glycosyltransferase
VLISTLTVAATWALGIPVVSRQAALLGALLMAIDIESINLSFFLLSEAMFAFLLLVALLAWVCFEQAERLSYLVISAALIGLAILCRPIAIYFPELICYSSLQHLKVVHVLS